MRFEDHEKLAKDKNQKIQQLEIHLDGARTKNAKLNRDNQKLANQNALLRQDLHRVKAMFKKLHPNFRDNQRPPPRRRGQAV